ncbi:MAG: hypothetical protein MRY32_02365, partial [Rickettsiales bacterium]|nr:hypothetical protein [Rickettsiales bacterium]
QANYKYELVTGGSVAAPAVANIVKHIAPMMGVQPVFEAGEEADGVWLAAQNEREAIERSTRRRRALQHAVSY